jgi:hypothetical protein
MYACMHTSFEIGGSTLHVLVDLLVCTWYVPVYCESSGMRAASGRRLTEKR